MDDAGGRHTNRVRCFKQTLGGPPTAPASAANISSRFGTGLLEFVIPYYRIAASANLVEVALALPRNRIKNAVAIDLFARWVNLQ